MTATQPYAAPAQKKAFLCMILYHTNPSATPPLYNAGVSFAREGFEVETICLSTLPDYPELEEVVPGYRIRRFYFRTRTFFHKRFGLSPSNPIVAGLQYILSYTEFVIRTVHRALRLKADLYEAHDLPALFPALVAAKMRRKPIVYHAHELYPEMHKDLRFVGFWKFLEKIFVPRATLVVTPEEHRSRIYREEYGAARPPLTIANCPPYQPPIRSTKLREILAERGLTAETIILYQGLLDPSRCVEELVAAAKSFDRGILLVLLGAGFKGLDSLQAAVDAVNNVVLLPRVQYNDLFQYTASADIGVLFYRNDCRNNYYCAPNKLYEFMMMGLPVITCDYPGLKKFVEGKELGYCVNPEKPEEIARAVNRLAADKAERARFSANGLRLAREEYNWQREFERLSAAYGRIFSENGHPEWAGEQPVAISMPETPVGEAAPQR